MTILHLLGVVFLNKKSETLKKLQGLMRLFQNEKSLTIIKNRSDHGSEFLNQVIREYCEANGILHKLSVVGIP